MNSHVAHGLGVVCALLFATSPASAQSANSLSGTWKTTYNAWNVIHSGNRISGKYGSDEGRIIGTLSGQVLNGFWIEKGSDYKCEVAKDGSYHWGAITFTFDDDGQKFTGDWTYCDSTASQGGWHGERISAPGNTEACDVTDLQRKAEKLTRAVSRAHNLLDQHEQKYLAFYEGSQVKMEASFDKVYHEVPGVIPFSNSTNAALSTMRIETRQRLRHMPKIKLLKSPKFDSAVNVFLGVVDDLAGLLGGNAGILKHSGTVGKWGAFFSDQINEKTYPYDEGIRIFTQLMNERQKVLDTYRGDVHRYFCKGVLPIEREINAARKALTQSNCNQSERNALDGWFSRGTQMSNQTMLDVATTSCAGNW